MSTLQVTTVTSPDANTPLILQTGNTSGGQIVLNAANTDIQMQGNFKFSNTAFAGDLNFSGNVGIGITPNLKLNVKSPGDYRTALFETVSTLGPSVQIKGSKTYEFRSTNTGASEGAGLFFIYDKDNEASRLTIDANGKMGVGKTTTLGAKLEIGSGGLAVQGASGYPVSGYGWELINEDSGNAAQQSYNRDTSSWMTSKWYAAGHIWICGGNEKARLSSTGLGIGQTNPAYPLDILQSNLGNTSGNTIQPFRMITNSGNADYFEGLWIRNASASGWNNATFRLRRNIDGTGGPQWIDYGNDGNISFATGSTSRLNIDLYGRVTKPSQPYMQGTAIPSNSLSGAGFNNGVDISFSRNFTDIGSNYNTSNGRFTAPVAGKYLICAYLLLSPSSSSSNDYRITLNVNGTQYTNTSYSKSAGYLTLAINQMVNLNANDWVAIRFWNDAGSGTLHADDGYNRLSITLIH